MVCVSAVTEKRAVACGDGTRTSCDIVDTAYFYFYFYFYFGGPYVHEDINQATGTDWGP